MKKFFSKVKTWLINHKPSKRRLIQVYAALLYNANIKGFVTGRIYTGNTKVMCVPGLNCYSCPGATGACPLGALQNTLASSNERAPYYVLGILALFCLILARTICGFLCPVGLGQELLYKIKTPKLKKNRVTKILSYLKYVLLVVLVFILPIILGPGFPTFCKYICPAGTLGGGVGLLFNPENADLFAMLSGLFTWKFALLVVIIVLSVFCYRAFCRFLCPLGALYGLFNRIALMGVKLDQTKCTDCGLCLNHCKMDISRVGDHECIECGECIAVCPVNAISWKGSKIFLHPNSIEAAKTAETAEADGNAPALANILSSGTAEISSAPEAAPEPVTELAPDAAHAEAEEVKAAVKTAEMPVLSPAERVKRRNRRLEIAAWAVASLFLIFVLVYYNFLAPADPEISVDKGAPCPAFTARTYDGTDSGGTFSLSDAEGKVVVLNFWFTTCGPCIQELPHFNAFQEEHADDVITVALHRTLSVGGEDVQSWISEKTDAATGKKWTDYSVIFAQDSDGLGGEHTLYTALGGSNNLYPMTVILNKEGKIAFTRKGSLTYEKLAEEVDKLL